MTVNWRAMQLAGSLDMKPISGLHPHPPSDVLPRYMAMGSYRTDLSKIHPHKKRKKSVASAPAAGTP